MSRYDRMANIPPSVERKAWLARNVERALAVEFGKPYCFDCDLQLGSHKALEQHTRAKHNPKDAGT